MSWVLRSTAVLFLAACTSARQVPTVRDLCRSEMTVPNVAPDTAASTRLLERAIADSLSARDRAAIRARDSVGTLPYELLGLLERWPYKHHLDVSRSDMFAALMLAELRGLYPPWTLGLLGDHLGEEPDGPERIWSLLALPPSECALANCAVRVVIVIESLADPWGRAVTEQMRSPFYRGSYCFLAKLYADSTWPVVHQDSIARDRGTVIIIGSHLLERLAATGTRSDTLFVETALRAARSSRTLFRELGRAFLADSPAWR